MGGDRGGRAHDGHHDVLEVCLLERPPQERERLQAAGRGIDELRVVVLPARLVLLGAAVVVDGEHDAADLAGRGAEIDGGLAAVAADLEHRADREPLTGEAMEGQPLVVGHEAAGGARQGEQVGWRRHRDATLPDPAGQARGLQLPRVPVS